jgi:hypothetical protein
MSVGITRDSRRVLGWITLAGGTFVLLYWALYFTRAVDLGQDDQFVNAFESAFPIADAVFAAALFAASYSLLKRRWPGPFFLVAAGSISLYLGILDTTFYVGRGISFPIDSEALLGLTINGMCIVGGIGALFIGWRYARSVSDGSPTEVAA